MWSVINKSTGKVLFATVFPFTETETQIAIEQVFSGEIPEGKELYFNFENNEFELR